MTIDTERLLALRLDAVKISPINSGSTIYVPQPRGQQTFQTLNDYPYKARRKKRGIANAIAEVAVDYSVPGIGGLVSRVCHMMGPNEMEVIFEQAF